MPGGLSCDFRGVRLLSPILSPIWHWSSATSPKTAYCAALSPPSSSVAGSSVSSSSASPPAPGLHTSQRLSSTLDHNPDTTARLGCLPWIQVTVLRLLHQSGARECRAVPPRQPALEPGPRLRVERPVGSWDPERLSGRHVRLPSCTVACDSCGIPSRSRQPTPTPEGHTRSRSP